MFWRLLRLLDEHMQHDNALLYYGTKENSGDAFLALDSQLEEPFTHGPGVRHSEVGAVKFHAFGIPQKARHETGRQLKQLLLERCAVERDSPVH